MSRPIASPFHAGEIAVQGRAGVHDQARRVGGIIGATLPPDARRFLQRQRLVIIASIGGDGRAWASLLAGPPGFLSAEGESALRVAAAPAVGDPLAANIAATEKVGLLVFDPATRQRWRINGTATLTADGLLLRTAQVYGNCPKYIQARTLVNEATTAATPTRVRGARLDAPQQRLIAGADTFFIASADAARNADASHRGGAPGFIRVLDERTLAWPDYAGNTMFNTLGNLAVNPHAGLLFIDFADGSTLQLAGSARIDWDPARAATFPGAERVVEFQIGEVLATAGATTQRWELRERSPFNPPTSA